MAPINTIESSLKASLKINSILGRKLSVGLSPYICAVKVCKGNRYSKDIHLFTLLCTAFENAFQRQ